MLTDEHGVCHEASDGECEALAQVELSQENARLDEQELLCQYDASPSFVVTRVLTSQPQGYEVQRLNLLKTRARIQGKDILVIIDGGSCHNLEGQELCIKLDLPLRKNKDPYHIQWLSDSGNVKIEHQVSVSLKIGPYEDTVECDVVPMTVCHMLLGRPWKFDKGAIHDGRANTYAFKWNNKNFVLQPCDYHEPNG